MFVAACQALLGAVCLLVWKGDIATYMTATATYGQCKTFKEQDLYFAFALLERLHRLQSFAFKGPIWGNFTGPMSKDIHWN